MKEYKKYFKLDASPADLYNALTNPVMIEIWTGEPCVMNTEQGSEFSLWDGEITGRNIEFVENFKMSNTGILVRKTTQLSRSSCIPIRKGPTWKSIRPISLTMLMKISQRVGNRITLEVYRSYLTNKLRIKIQKLCLSYNDGHLLKNKLRE